MISYDEFKIIMGYAGDNDKGEVAEVVPLTLNFTKAKGEKLKQLL